MPSFQLTDEQIDEISQAVFSVTRFYDARGNIYGVVSPEYLRRRGVELPDSADLAAKARQAWTDQGLILQVEDGTLSSVSLFGTAYPQA
ncbi:hypothetical protein [Pseudomonas sp. 31 R 17]|uniref:hypothetical protein n=1 Tax=Pseudomonas sp. 31 R 17 TaxID=1844101 RepID=UPI00081BF40D